MAKAKRRKKKKLKLRSSAIRFLCYFSFYFIMAIYILCQSIKIYNLYEYKKTYEYKLIEMGYSEKDTKVMLNKLDDDKIEYILEQEYNEIYPNIVKQKYYMDKYFDNYVYYMMYHSKVSYNDGVSIVNVHANEGWYNISYDTDLTQGDLFLVNKFYHLNSEFIPHDLEKISIQYAYSGQSAASYVIEAYKEMRAEVKEKLNVDLMVNSSYRSYQEQEEIYNDYKTVSQRYADSYAARPGYSEHQTGLALDLTSLQHPSAKAFNESEEYQWLKKNCYKYGFILRYPEDKEDITGYNTESWHFRYVGKSVAKVIHNENLTLDEYYAFYIEN